MARAPRFPVSDHCDGLRFFNPRGLLQARSFSSLPKWWWQKACGQGVAWPRHVPPPRRPEQDMPALWDSTALEAEAAGAPDGEPSA